MADYRGTRMLTGDKRTREVKHWTQWLRQVPGIRRKFCRWTEDFDPFHSNEAASVAVLANAAAKAGYLAHTEYVALKRHPSRGRPFRQGRCDLWIADVDNELSWAFEVKQHFAAAKIRQSTFNSRLERACNDAKDVDRDEANSRVGCLIVVPGLHFEQTPDLVEHFDDLCADADVAFRIGGGVGSIWLAFVFVD
ncbi:hypothetical protein KY084_02060 [Stakelama sp. CBK3Z-3]|uniref:Restriction endonuclease type IV Mrr domain-containing protein n=1 Tax=Stakelama flava TaxID=2860338 RepID=A0ABS6XHH2_9SPHN|nr:hypothetical protein [Stakelama flava]MBW4329658.1 hypothetical protein [Stakelama flava]